MFRLQSDFEAIQKLLRLSHGDQRRQIVNISPALKRIKRRVIPLAIFLTTDIRRSIIAFADQHEIQKQPPGSSIAVGKRMNRLELRMKP